MDTAQKKIEPQLVTDAQKGDSAAFISLLQANWMWLKALVLGILGIGCDCDDVLQNICLQVISKINTLRNPDKFKPWLAAVARNEALIYRNKKRFAPASTDNTLLDRLPNPQTDIADHLEQKQLREELFGAIENLPQKYSEVIALRYGSELTYGQIAEVLNLPITTVQIRLVRARHTLLKILTRKNHVFSGS